MLLGLTVGIAVWDAIDERTETTRSILQNASGIGLGLALDVALEEAPLESAVDALVGAGLIGEASISAALAPTGIGILIGLAVSALIDLFFSLFWTDVTFPPRLVVALTAPMTNDLHAQLTNPLLNVLTNDLAGALDKDKPIKENSIMISGAVVNAQLAAAVGGDPSQPPDSSPQALTSLALNQLGSVETDAIKNVNALKEAFGTGVCTLITLFNASADDMNLIFTADAAWSHWIGAV